MIRILLADDHAILRAGLRRLLEPQPDMTVVAEAEDAEQTVARVDEIAPDIAVVDLDMPRGGGIWTISEIARRSPETRVLVLTLHDDLAYLRASLAAGAAGYLVKSAADTDLLKAIRTVHQGRTHIDVSVGANLGEVVAPVPAARSSGASLELLSDRERQVLKLVALGYTHREVADKVHLSIKTIETYRSRIAEKLELRSRADLVRYALDIGLVSRTGGEASRF